MNRREEIEAERRREAEAVLARAARESEVFGDSAAKPADRSTGGRLADHFSAADAPQDDAVEVWGRRIARIAALVVALGLLVHLVGTYLVG